jgi:hypothetical protein
VATLLDEAETFANEHDIHAVFPEKRVRKIKQMPGELVTDENIMEAAKLFQVSVYIRSLDTVLLQLKERFSEDTLCFLKEMQLFTPASLSSRKSVSSHDIHKLCTYYDIDSLAVCRELKAFSVAYHQVEKLVSLADITDNTLNRNVAPGDVENDQRCGEDEDKDHVDMATDVKLNLLKWTEHGFIKPLRVINEFSGFPTLTYLYKILNSLLVTSCNAERAMSRVHIIKNHLRCTMSDDWFSALMVLSSERDLLHSIAIDDIIDHFTLCSVPLQKQLKYQ